MAHLASIPSHPSDPLVWLSASDTFVFTNSLKRLSHSEWRGKGTTSREQYPVASQVVKEHGVPGLHRPVGEQHIDLTRGIKVKCARIDDGGKDVFPIEPDESIGRLSQAHPPWPPFAVPSGSAAVCPLLLGPGTSTSSDAPPSPRQSETKQTGASEALIRVRDRPKSRVRAEPAKVVPGSCCGSGSYVISQACAPHSPCLRISATYWNTTSGGAAMEMVFSRLNMVCTFLQQWPSTIRYFFEQVSRGWQARESPPHTAIGI